MANTYVITSITYSSLASGDPLATITGTVNGTPITCVAWKSAINQQASAIAFQNFIQPIMLAAYQQIVPPANSTIVPLISTFTV